MGPAGSAIRLNIRYFRSFIWYMIYGSIYSVNMIFTILTGIYLIAVPKCFPRTMRLWLMPMCLVDLLGTGLNGMRIMFDRSYPQRRMTFPGLAKCRTMNIVIYSLEDLSQFYLLGLSIERVIFVLKPLKASTIVTPLKVKIAVILITIYDLGMNLTWVLLIYQRVNPKRQNQCIEEAANAYRTPFRLGALKLPFYLISIVCSILLFKAVVTSAKARAKMSKAGESEVDLKREKRLGFLLLLMNLSFIFFTLPRDIMLAVNMIFAKRKIWFLGLDLTTFYFLYSTSMLNVRVANAINWIFYCGVSSKFWAWYRKLLCPCLKPKEKQSTRVTTMTSSVSKG